jgi:hypothetical protein
LHLQSYTFVAHVLTRSTLPTLSLLAAVDDEAFWQGVQPLEFGPLPRLQDSVAVVGYPIGGDTISVTVGVVSRIEVRLSTAQVGDMFLCSFHKREHKAIQQQPWQGFATTAPNHQQLYVSEHTSAVHSRMLQQPHVPLNRR